MMVPHYTLAELVYCSGSDLAGQSFGVALVEQKVTIAVGQVVEAKEREESCIGASTPDEVQCTEAVAEQRIEMNGWLVGLDIEM